MVKPTNHNPLIDETDPVQTVNNVACAFIYLSERLDEYVADEQARQGRWLLHNVVIEALLYETARLIRVQKLEKLL